MFLRLLVPLTLLFPVLSVFVQGTSLKRYHGTWARESLALVFCIIVYFIVWYAVLTLVEAVTGSGAAALVVSSLAALLSLYPGLWLGFKLFGVGPSAREPAEAH